MEEVLSNPEPNWTPHNAHIQISSVPAVRVCVLTKHASLASINTKTGNCLHDNQKTQAGFCDEKCVIPWANNNACHWPLCLKAPRFPLPVTACGYTSVKCALPEPNQTSRATHRSLSIHTKSRCDVNGKDALQSRAALETQVCAYSNMDCTRSACLRGNPSPNLLGPSHAESKRKTNEQYRVQCSAVQLVCQRLRNT